MDVCPFPPHQPTQPITHREQGTHRAPDSGSKVFHLKTPKLTINKKMSQELSKAETQEIFRKLRQKRENKARFNTN
jgi:hypothetical protein